MKMRCNSPTASNYARYGALGIRVCEQWLNDFEAFYRDVGSRPSAEHSIDRIDAKGNYEPGNCRWATRDEQRNNRRNTVYVIYRGERMPLLRAWEASGRLVSKNVAKCRVRAGWDVTKALETQEIGKGWRKGMRT